jgi:hypothetical protein
LSTKIPRPLAAGRFIEKESGFIVTLFKDIYSEEEFKNKGLNERQIEELLFFKVQKE